ncbi:MAG: addiction module protein [Xanthomonadales bacterium]|nr:addiction module protein [Xanthomonadales bacterium]
MTITLETLQAQILGLPKADRSRLLDQLVASLDVDFEAESHWEQLMDRRDRELESGLIAPVPLEAALARLKGRFPG